MPRILELNCWVFGDDPNHVFSVEIEDTKTVSALKKAIKDEKEPTFDHIPADSLTLRKVIIFDCDVNPLIKLNISGIYNC